MHLLCRGLSFGPVLKVYQALPRLSFSPSSSVSSLHASSSASSSACTTLLRTPQNT